MKDQRLNSNHLFSRSTAAEPLTAIHGHGDEWRQMALSGWSGGGWVDGGVGAGEWVGKYYLQNR